MTRRAPARAVRLGVPAVAFLLAPPALAPAVLGAQQRSTPAAGARCPVASPADTTRRAPADTTPRTPADTSRRVPPLAGADTAARDSTTLVRFAEPDSTTAALLRRPGYTATRYQGDTVRFLAQQRVLVLEGRPAAVQRDQTLLVGSTVTYDDSAQIVTAGADSAAGDTVVLRDPQQGSDVVVRGGIRYDLTERRGIVTGFSTAAEQGGETWLVSGERGAIQTDTVVNGQRVFYARDGAVTTCNETTPHYHFEARDIKMVSKSILVIRPAVLYIGEVPVMWLPFIFTDPRSGRRSGLLSPRFGVAELLRNSPTYRRQIENFGYYWNLSDYVDAQSWVNWRSGARERQGDPGFFSLNGEMRYRNLNRFLQGQLALGQEWFRDGRRNATVTVRHEQSFNENRRFNANINWTQSTQLRQQNAFNAAQALGNIRSSVNYSDRFGPFSLQAGGSAVQYPGRPQTDLSFPNVSLSSRTISVREWLEWTPVLSLDNQQSLNIDQGLQFGELLRPRVGGGIDTTRLRASRRNTNLRLDSPLKIFRFNWANNFNFTEEVQDFPESRVVYRDIRDSTTKETRVFAQRFLSSLDWNTSFALPGFLQGSWNVTPSLGFQNVDGSRGLFVRSEQSGGEWVAQRKRPNVGLSASPTFYAFAPGFGGVERFRHSISPVVSYSYSPRADVSDRFLQAIGQRRQGYLGSLVQNRVSLQFSTNLEAKLRAKPVAVGARGDGARGDSTRADTTGVAFGAGAAAGVIPTSGGSANVEGRKVRVASLTFTGLSYDFARADSTGIGFTDRTFGYQFRSDLLPGFDFNTQYDLFLGDPQSDTATFRPYRTQTNINFQLDRNSSVFGAIARLFGRRITPAAERTASASTQEPTRGGDAFFNQQSLAQQAAGNFPRQSQFEIPTQDWRLSIGYTESRQRPDLRGNIITLDPAFRCQALLQAQRVAEFEICRLNAIAAPPPGQPLPQTSAGGPIFIQPPQRGVNLQSAFSITPKWTAQWTTQYDLVRSRFGTNSVNLQRELHDWRATFGFTQAPNGNFAFTFFIALKAEPDLKFNYNRQNFPRLGQQF